MKGNSEQPNRTNLIVDIVHKQDIVAKTVLFSRDEKRLEGGPVKMNIGSLWYNVKCGTR